MDDTEFDLGYPSGLDPVDANVLASIPASFQATASRFPDAVALRSVDDQVRTTWAQMADDVRRISGALAALGVVRGDTVALMMANRPEHEVVDLAALHLGATTTTIYSTLPVNDIHYVLTDAGCRVLVLEAAHLPAVTAAVRDYGLRLDHLVVLGGIAEPSNIPLQAITYEEFRSSCPPDGFDFERCWRSVDRSDLALVIYTSGTTGTPKGVELTHGNLLFTMHGWTCVMPMGPGSRLVSVFPFAHVAERMGTYYMAVLQGHCVTFCPDIRDLDDYYLLVRPHYLFLTPRSLERFRARIERHIALESDDAEKGRQRRAVDVGIELIRHQQANDPVSEVLAREWRELGPTREFLLRLVGLDDVQYAGVGSAPVPADLMVYFLGLELPIFEGWGLTETGAAAARGRRGQVRVGWIGPAMPGVELRLAVDGEILVRSGGVMAGYRNKPEQTREFLDVDGWLHTGDIGEFSPDGFLRVIDRKNSIIINANGKNMSPTRIEAKLRNAGCLISQAVVFGDGKDYNVAILTLDPAGAEDFCGRHGLAIDTPRGKLVRDPRLRAEARREVDRGNAGLSEAERVRDWVLLENDWTPGSVELTPTMKVRRGEIGKKYADLVAALYSAKEVS